MKVYVTNSVNKGSGLIISERAKEKLQGYVPRWCPFKGYTMYDLVVDLVNMYGWKISGKVSLSDFINLLKSENYSKAITYGTGIMEILEEA